MARVATVTSGGVRQNGYVVGLETGTAVVIDPGAEAERFSALIAGHGARLAAILVTHGHFDHIGAAQELIEAFGAPCYLHGADHALARRAHLYSAALGGGDVRRRTLRDVLLLEAEAETLAFGPLTVSWRPTPGHTAGSVCYFAGDHVFTGDSLLPSGHATSALPGADPDARAATIAAMRGWDPALPAAPGHGRIRPLGELLNEHGGDGADGRD